MSNHPSKRYPLLPFSQLVYDMTRWMPGMYRFPIVYRWVNGAKEKERIEHAIRSALANHPIFQMSVDRKGLHYANPLEDIFHGPYHDVNLTEEGEDLIIRGQFSRILGDGKSGEILLEDIRRAYEGLPLEPDDYWGYVEYVEQLKQSQHYTESKAWLESEFAEESVPVRPTIDRRRLSTILPPKPGLYKMDLTNRYEQINQLKDDQFISFEGIFCLCAALAIAEYCGTENAALTWAYEGRETEMEQRIFGSLHRDISFMIKVKGERLKVKGELIREARNQIRSGIAHSDYPYTLTAPYTKRWDYAVNVLRVPEIENNPKYAYALLDIEIHETADNLSLWFRYSATHYKEESIKKFAALVRKYAEWLLTD